MYKKKLILCAAFVCCSPNETISKANIDPAILSRKVRGLADITGPLVLTLSSKIWSAFNIEDVFWNETMNSTMSSNVSGSVGIVKYNVWNAKLESLFFSTKNISFRKFRYGGFRVRIKGVKFFASTNLELEVRLWLALKFSGKVLIMSDNIRVDLGFIWTNFTIAAKIRMGSNIRLFFTGSLLYFNLVEPMLRSIIKKNIEEQIKKVLESEVNPYLQQLRKMVIGAGLSFLFKEPIKWALHNDSLQIVLNSKSSNNATLNLVPADKMVCLSTDVLQLFMMLWAVLFRTPRKTIEGLDITCIAPEFSCIGATCTFCTDLSIARSPRESSRRSFLKCIPRVNLVTWALNNFAHFKNLISK